MCINTGGGHTRGRRLGRGRANLTPNRTQTSLAIDTDIHCTPSPPINVGRAPRRTGWWNTPRFDPLQMVPANKSVLAFNLSFLFNRRDILDMAMDQLLGWVASGELAMPRVTEFALVDVRRAHAALESGSTVGKLVLVP